MNIISYDNALHRDRVITLWTDTFGYTARRNDPALVIDKKLAHKDHLFYVADDNGTLAGTIMAGYDGHRGWIYSLMVAPPMRRRGIGTALLHHAEQALKELRCVKINLQILATNGAVTAFYEKCGYAVEERISMGKEIPDSISGR